jgi:hypothetical protein
MKRPLNILLAALASAIVVVIAVLLQGDGGGKPTADRLPRLTPTPTLDPLSAGDFFLELIEPGEDEVIVGTASFTLIGRTRADAVVSVNDLLVEPDVDDVFRVTFVLDEGPNIIKVVASVANQDPLDRVLAVIYAP